ncbi:MAG: arginase family protein [Anaerolineae bacterium]|nr:arginase family protein [Anaerolineae bacterium]
MLAEFVCIGVPYFLGDLVAGRTEVAQVKASGFASSIGAPWIDLAPDFGYGIDPVVAVNQALAEVIAAHSGRIPLIFADDCVSCLGVMKGLERHHPAVVWFDAHGDFNTPQTTPSGFLGGMPLAMLVGRGDLSLLEALDLDPIPEEDVILTDARDLDPMESIALRGSGITHLMQVEDLMTAALPTGPLYIHLDTDVIDPFELPGMSYPAPDGPSVRRVQAALERVTREGHPVGILFSLWSAALTDDPRPLEVTLALAGTFVETLAEKVS